MSFLLLLHRGTLLHNDRGVQVIVFGRSLGGAVAFGLAAANPGSINSLIVENTFWSIEAVTGKVSQQNAWTQNPL